MTGERLRKGVEMDEDLYVVRVGDPYVACGDTHFTVDGRRFAPRIRTEPGRRGGRRRLRREQGQLLEDR